MNAQLHREYWGYDHRKCIIYCRDEHPASRRRHRPGERCPHCYGPVAVRSIHADDIEPEPSRTARLTAWIGEWAAAFWASLTYPLHVCPACEPAQDDEITQACPQCGATEDRKEA
jgi:hypothetical protein